MKHSKTHWFKLYVFMNFNRIILYTHDQKVTLEYWGPSQHHPRQPLIFCYYRLYKSSLKLPMHITCLASFIQRKVFGFICVTACMNGLFDYCFDLVQYIVTSHVVFSFICWWTSELFIFNFWLLPIKLYWISVCKSLYGYFFWLYT